MGFIMSQAYSLFKIHTATALEANNSAAALEIVNNPEGVDLAGTAADIPRKWAWFRDQVGNEAAITVRATVEQIVTAKPADPATDPTAYAFAVNAAAILAQLDTVGISPCDSELRLALRTVIQANPAVATAFTKALLTGYQSPAQSVLGRDATAEDFAEARTRWEKVNAIDTAISAEQALAAPHNTAVSRLQSLKTQDTYALSLAEIEAEIATVREYPETYPAEGV